MTDIVEQLRNHHKDIGLPDNVESWLTSAADEIERLRAALRNAHAIIVRAQNYRGYEGGPLFEPFAELVELEARTALGEKE